VDLHGDVDLHEDVDLHADVDRQGEAPHEGDRRVAPHQGEDVSTDRVFCFVPCPLSSLFCVHPHL
jgi:hypothetical protein